MHSENEIVPISHFAWQQLKQELAALGERMAKLERSQVPPVDLQALLGPDADFSVYESKPRESVLPAATSAANGKEAMEAINVLSRSILGLLESPAMSNKWLKIACSKSRTFHFQEA